VVRGDVGGFGAGSQFTWQAIGTYNWLLGVTHGIPVDGYVGFRALSADYSQGSGTSKFTFDNVIYGPTLDRAMTAPLTGNRSDRFPTTESLVGHWFGKRGGGCANPPPS
jgi:hypothetical protein